MPPAEPELPHLRKAVVRQRGRLFEDFAPGQTFVHHWGRTIGESDALLFTSLAMSFTPLYFNREYARAHGHPDIVVNPLLVFNVVLGLSVEDLSERDSLFLGVEALTWHAPVYPGDTLTARSTTLSARGSKSRADRGIVSWHTEGFNQQGARVIDYRRSNLLRRRGAGE